MASLCVPVSLAAHMNSARSLHEQLEHLMELHCPALLANGGRLGAQAWQVAKVCSCPQLILESLCCRLY